MFIGHFAIGLLGKQKDPLPSLAMLFIAVQFLDLLWPVLVLVGIESLSIDPGNTKMTPLNFEHYPYSHSLFMAIVWSALFGMIYFFVTKNKKGSWLLTGLVMSHWVLDLITHRPDLPLSPFTEQKFGLGLWNVPAVAIPLEVGLFGVGIYWYLKQAGTIRKTSFWILSVFLLLIYFLNLFGPPAPDPMAVAWSANLMWIIIIWAWWIEKKKPNTISSKNEL